MNRNLLKIAIVLSNFCVLLVGSGCDPYTTTPQNRPPVTGKICANFTWDGKIPREGGGSASVVAYSKGGGDATINLSHDYINGRPRCQSFTVDLSGLIPGNVSGAASCEIMGHNFPARSVTISKGTNEQYFVLVECERWNDQETAFDYTAVLLDIWKSVINRSSALARANSNVLKKLSSPQSQGREAHESSKRSAQIAN